MDMNRLRDEQGTRVRNGCDSQPASSTGTVAGAGPKRTLGNACRQSIGRTSDL